MVVEGELVVVERSLSLKGKIPFGLGVVVTDSPKYFIIIQSHQEFIKLSNRFSAM